MAFPMEEPLERPITNNPTLLARPMTTCPRCDGTRILGLVRPSDMNAYEFVAVAALRAQQLLGGCTPRLAGEHSAATMAQMEVAAGRVARATDASLPMQCRWQR